jgi:hypothetical protein
MVVQFGSIILNHPVGFTCRSIGRRVSVYARQLIKGFVVLWRCVQFCQLFLVLGFTQLGALPNVEAMTHCKFFPSQFETFQRFINDYFAETWTVLRELLQAFSYLDFLSANVPFDNTFVVRLRRIIREGQVKIAFEYVPRCPSNHLNWFGNQPTLKSPQRTVDHIGVSTVYTIDYVVDLLRSLQCQPERLTHRFCFHAKLLPKSLA